MRYLVTSKTDSFKPFFTEWFGLEMLSDNMTVFDLLDEQYLNEIGGEWQDIERDSL